MTTEERRTALKDDIVIKYERLKHKDAVAYHCGKISEDDFRMRIKFINREMNIRLNEIDQMPYNKAKYYYEKLMKKSPGR